ncbi:alkaline phosphatase family protein [Pedobacter sp. AW31-3R]|uniref:alkaline phosphatase family protein n=1 Tax=Pedobacter sp. AW31-3R TaxID=3445781 RepID=UPI003FA11DDF
MKYNQILWTTLLLLNAATGWSQDNKTAPKDIRHVVVIGIDGLSPDGIRKAPTPVMDKMIAEGSVKWNVRTVLPSSSSPNWASMIMGAGLEAHGILDNDWEMKDASLPPIAAGPSGLFPTIFSVVKKAKPEAEIGAVYHWDGFGRLVEKESLSYDKHFDSEDESTNDFVAYLQRKKPTLAFLQLDHVDGAGHGAGHGTIPYFESIAKADSLVGVILRGLEKSGMMKHTLVIITSDHGGVGYGHGGATPAEAEIAMIFYGQGVKQGYKVKQQVYTYDLAASIAFALKVTPPYVWTGRPVKSAFAGFGEPENLWLGKELIPSPVIYPDKYLFAQAGGLYKDKQPTVKIEAVMPDTEIRYTLDGSQPGPGAQRYSGPFALDKTTVVKAQAFDKSGNESLVSNAYFRLVKSNQGNGLKVSFFLGKNWAALPDFKKLTANKQWESDEFNLDRGFLLPLMGKGSNFALSFDGYLDIQTDGEYTFYTQSDDGSELYINDQKVVDNNGSHGVIERSGKINLKKGRHAIKALYFNEMGGFWLEVFYAGPGLARQIVPADRLFLKPAEKQMEKYNY